MSDQRELDMTDCKVASYPPAAAPRLLQRMLDLTRYTALRSLGLHSANRKTAQIWDGLEPFDLLRGWQPGKE